MIKKAEVTGGLIGNEKEDKIAKTASERIVYEERSQKQRKHKNKNKNTTEKYIIQPEK